MTGKQRFQEVQFLDGSSGFCTCGDDTHHIARTGKQRVLEILQQLASDQCDKVNPYKLQPPAQNKDALQTNNKEEEV